jgi:NADPH-dependent curcumin reductase
MATSNKQVLLASRPQGTVTEENFRIVEAPLATPAAGEVLVKNEWLSLDPYMRGRMSDAKSYVPPVPIDEVMVGQTVGEVIESQDPRFKPGDKVLTQLGWQLYGVAKASELIRIDVKRAPASYYLGVLGMPGITAWFGLSEIGQPKAGETVVVSAASGAVGSVVGQLAKIKGCRAVGIAGGAEKCRYVTEELGFDACIDYKSQDVAQSLKEAAPQGVDGYFENVGGEILDAVLPRMNAFGRIALCGLIAGYDGKPIPLKNPAWFLISRLKLQGFIVSEHMDVWPAALKELGVQVAAGRIKYRESIANGLVNAPQAFLGMLKGANFGKQLVKLTP